MHAAAAAGNLDRVRALLLQGVDKDAEYSDQAGTPKWTPLMAAAYHGRHEVVRALLQAGADPSPKDRAGNSALAVAAFESHAACVQELAMHEGARRDKEEVGKAMEAAAEFGDQPMLELLMRHARPGPPQLSVALFLAAQEGHHELLQPLLAAGAQPGWTGEGAGRPPGVCDTALTVAARKGHLLCVRKLMGHVKPEPGHAATALCFALEAGHMHVARLLMQRGAAAEKPWPSPHGLVLFPLMMALKRGDLQLVKLLLEHGADVNLATVAPTMPVVDGFTCLHVAAEMGHVGITAALLEHGADVGLLTGGSGGRGGLSAMYQAAALGHVGVMELLHKAGADVSARAATQHRPVEAAAAHGQVAAVQFLLERGADINSCDNALRNSVLHLSVKMGHVEMVHMLILRGADLDQRAITGRTPRMLLTAWSTLPLDCVKGRALVAANEAALTGKHIPCDVDASGVCWECGASDVPLKLCSACKVVSYCGPKCQLRDWKEGGHKARCAKLKGLLEGEGPLEHFSPQLSPALSQYRAASGTGSTQLALRPPAPRQRKLPGPQLQLLTAQLEQLLQRPLPFSTEQEVLLRELLADVLPEVRRRHVHLQHMTAPLPEP